MQRVPPSETDRARHIVAGRGGCGTLTLSWQCLRPASSHPFLAHQRGSSPDSAWAAGLCAPDAGHQGLAREDVGKEASPQPLHSQQLAASCPACWRGAGRGWGKLRGAEEERSGGEAERAQAMQNGLGEPAGEATEHGRRAGRWCRKDGQWTRPPQERVCVSSQDPAARSACQGCTGLRKADN